MGQDYFKRNFFLYSFYIFSVGFFSTVGKNSNTIPVSMDKDQCSTYNMKANSILYKIILARSSLIFTSLWEVLMLMDQCTW